MPTALSPDSLRRVIYSKYLLERAQLLDSAGHELALASAVLTVHDAVEMLMRVATDPLNVRPDYKFQEFWGIIQDERGIQLPLRVAMDRLNHARNGFKHKGIAPNPNTVRDCITNAISFCEEVSQQCLGTDYRAVSLADLIQNDAARKYTKDAEVAKDTGDSQNAIWLLALAFDALFGEACRRHQITLVGGFKTDSHWKIPSELRFQFSEELKKINRMAEVVDTLVLGLDVAKFRRFSEITPHRQYFADGHVEAIYHPWDAGTNKDADYTFCHGFVIDCALRLLAL